MPPRVEPGDGARDRRADRMRLGKPGFGAENGRAVGHDVRFLVSIGAMLPNWQQPGKNEFCRVGNKGPSLDARLQTRCDGPATSAQAGQAVFPPEIV